MTRRPLSLVMLAGAGLLTACPGIDIPPVPVDGSSSDDGSTGPATPPLTTDVDPDSTTVADESSSTGSTSIDPDSSTTDVQTCGNGMLDGDEVCDGDELSGETCASQGFDSGQLACAADCSGYDTRACAMFNCGNGVVEGSEVCDGADVGGVTCEGEGFDSGTITCALDCSALDTSDCGTCGNVIVDGDEVCDSIVLLGQTCMSQGYSSGQLGCSADCLSYDVASCIQCGNDLIDGIEPCDGVDLGGETCVSQGYVGGVLACDADCSAFDISGCNTCGNAIVDAGEACDGMNLGGASCASLGLMGGVLACTPGCQFDFSGCDIPGVPFGSDAFYTGISLNPMPLPCDDISASGTNAFLDDDDEVGVPMGFTFTFYGVPFTQATIASNGAIYFNSTDYLDYLNVCMPGDTFSPVTNYILAPFWTDLDPSSAGAVRYQTLGAAPNQRFVVQWDVPFYGGSVADLIRVQAMFQQDGSIQVCYPDTISVGDPGNSGAGATSGVQQNPLTGFQYSCDAPNLTNGLMLAYLPT
ncbi:hypothetical protein [Paraliomyxa miuraensis]|uniref:hypothetical protein n=1 Tax=Paraliomyxa miuraensis TaxID=376150 RepID=UPI0022537CFC|nr:hypothetical protein [Paraliomyxa miuraensis]MCX4241523.1 hypothetical protein [Paraliomyxa miuraensis]